MRKTWLEENQRLVAVDNFGNDLAAVEAAQKKHEAIETDIMVSRLDLMPNNSVNLKIKQLTDLHLNYLIIFHDFFL